jgi:hypothetical protein
MQRDVMKIGAGLLLSIALVGATFGDAPSQTPGINMLICLGTEGGGADKATCAPKASPQGASQANNKVLKDRKGKPRRVPAINGKIGLTMDPAIAVAGTIASTKPKFSCPPVDSCAVDLPNGTSVTMTAVPNEAAGQNHGWWHWGGDCSGAAATCKVTVQGRMTVKAFFFMK